MSRKRDSALGSKAILEALKGSIGALRWGLVILLAIYLTSGITAVKPHETALVLRFGKLQKEVRSSGLAFAFPEPIDRVVKFPTRSVQELQLDAWSAPAAEPPKLDPLTQLPLVPENVRLHPARDGYTLTGDTNIIQGRFSLRYQIVDPVAWFHLGEQRQALLESIGYRAAAVALAARPVDQVLTAGREKLQDDMLGIAQGAADGLRLGVKLTACQVRELVPTRQVLPAFEEVVNAQMEARTVVEDARAYQAAQIPAAQAEAYRLKQEANSYRRNLVAKAQGEATSFVSLLEQYQQNAQLVRTRLRSETLSAVMPQVATKSILPASNSDTRIFIDPKPPGAP